MGGDDSILSKSPRGEEVNALELGFKVFGECGEAKRKGRNSTLF